MENSQFAVNSSQSTPRTSFRRSILLTLIATLALIWAGVPGTTTTAHANASGSTPPPGTVVHAASCEQAPAQSVKDRATYTPAELARYGLPPHTSGEPFDKWARVVRAAGQRVCDYTIGVGRWWTLIPKENWNGFVGDESYPGQNYTEADMDYYVPCITGIPSDPPGGAPDPGGTAVMSAWIGLGGVDPDPYLIQAGTVDFQNWDSVHGYQNQYIAFLENAGDPTDFGPHYFFTMSCNTHIFAKVWASHCMFVQNIDNRGQYAEQCFGHNTSGLSGEAVSERSKDTFDYPYFTRFFDPSSSTYSITFHGVAITDNGHYDAMYQAPHNKNQAYRCTTYDQTGQKCMQYDMAHPFATVGDIELDPNESPNDKYTVTWQYYGPPRQP